MRSSEEKVIYKRRVTSCTGNVKFAVTFPVGITKEFIQFCVKKGYTEMPHLTRVGLMHLQKGNVIITGAICNREGTMFCVPGIKADECEKLIEKAAEELTETFLEFK